MIPENIEDTNQVEETKPKRGRPAKAKVETKQTTLETPIVAATSDTGIMPFADATWQDTDSANLKALADGLATHFSSTDPLKSILEIIDTAIERNGTILELEIKSAIGNLAMDGGGESILLTLQKTMIGVNSIESNTATIVENTTGLKTDIQTLATSVDTLTTKLVEQTNKLDETLNKVLDKLSSGSSGGGSGSNDSLLQAILDRLNRA